MAEPLRAMVMGAPLEDARHLAQRYDRMRQEAEAQVSLICVYQRLSDGFIPATTILWSIMFIILISIQLLKTNMIS